MVFSMVVSSFRGIAGWPVGWPGSSIMERPYLPRAEPILKRSDGLRSSG
jgi:hypothetical protein